MENKSFRLTLLIASFFMLLTSCSPKKGADPTPSGEDVPSGDIFDDLDLGPGKELEDKSLFYSNHEYDVGRDFKVLVGIQSSEHSLRYKDTKAKLLALSDPIGTDDVVVITDKTSGQDISTDVTEVFIEEEGRNYYQISPTAGVYEEGAICSISLKDDDLFFRGKDPEMDTLYFNIPESESNTVNISSDVPFFDINKVTYFPIADHDYPQLDDLGSKEAKEFFNTATYHFGYKDNSFAQLAEDRHFGVSLINKNGEPNLSNDQTFYGRFVSSEKEGDHYKVTYKNADLTQIFQNDKGEITFDVCQSSNGLADMKNIKLLANDEQIKNMLEGNRSFMLMAGAVADVVGSTMYDILSKFYANIDFSYKNNTLNIQIKVGGVFPFGEKKNVAIEIGFVLQWAITMETTGGVEIEEFWGIPYSINAYGEVTKTTDFTFQFTIKLLRNYKPSEEDTRDIKDMIKDAYTKLENDPAYFMPRVDDGAVYSANHMSQDLVSLDIPFLYIFDFHVGLSFELTIDLNVMFRYGYHSHTVEKMLCFSTDDGIEDTSNPIKNKTATHTFDLGGNLYIEAGLRITVSVGIVGLKYLFTLGAYIEGGIYLSARAMGGISFGDDQATTFYGGIDLDIGFYGRIVGFMDFLFVFHPKYEFAGGKVSWFGYSSPITVMDLICGDVELTEHLTSIDTTGLLTAKIFDTKTFEVSIHTYRLNDYVTSSGDTFHPFTIEIDSKYSNYISLDQENNLIVIAQDAPDTFSGTFTVVTDTRIDYFYKQWSGASRKTVNFTYTNPNAHKVKCGEDDTNPLLFGEGKTFVFPQPKEVAGKGDKVEFTNKRYEYDSGTKQFTIKFDFEFDPAVYSFISYTDGVNNYKAGHVYTMGDKDVTITVNLYVVRYYTVNFYNGANELIKSSRTREYTKAEEPTEAERNMDGYLFVGWDRSFDFVISDLDIYGIYVRGN